MANLLDAVNDLREAIAKYCAITHNQPMAQYYAGDTLSPGGELDDRIAFAEIRLDKALRATHHLHADEAIEEIHVNAQSLTITTDTGRTFEIARNTKYIG